MWAYRLASYGGIVRRLEMRVGHDRPRRLLLLDCKSRSVSVSAVAVVIVATIARVETNMAQLMLDADRIGCVFEESEQ